VVNTILLVEPGDHGLRSSPEPLTDLEIPVTAEAAGSSPVAPAIFLNICFQRLTCRGSFTLELPH